MNLTLICILLIFFLTGCVQTGPITSEVRNVDLGQQPRENDLQQSILEQVKTPKASNPELVKLNEQGKTAYDLSMYQNALQIFEEGLEMANSLSQQEWRALFLGNLGIVYYKLGQYYQALNYSYQSLELYREINNLKGEARILIQLKNISLCSSLTFKETSYIKRLVNVKNSGQVCGDKQMILDIHKKIGFPGWHVEQHIPGTSIINFNRNTHNYEYYKRLLTIFREINDQKGEANTLAEFGLAYAKMKEYPEALEYLQKSLRLYSAIGDREGEASSLVTIGSMYYKLEQYPKALEIQQQSLGMLLHLGNHASILNIWHKLLLTLYKLDQPALAILAGKQAANLLLGMRANNQSFEQDLKKSFIEDYEYVLNDLAHILIEQGRLAEAEQVMAMLKEEEYFDFIQRDGQDDPRTTQAGYTQVEKGIATEINQFSSQLVSLGKEYESLEKLSLIDERAKIRLTKIEKDLEQAQAGFLKLLSDLENYFKQAGGGKALEFGERQLERLESQQGMLGKHQAVIITTIVTKEKLHLLLTTPEVQLARESAIGEKALNDLIKRFRNALKHPGSDPVPLAQELYTYLVKPLEKDLQQAQAKTLMWSLDGALRYVPLATLHDGQQFLIEKYGLSLYTAAAHNNLHENNVGSWRAAGLGVSLAHPGFEALPAVPNELRNIIRKNDDDQIGVLSGEIHLDRDFNRETFKSVVRAGYPVLHIASHFKLQPGDGSASKLLLGDGDTLSLDEFRRQAAFKLHGVDLLTLSACDTAVGDKGAGGEVESFAVMAQLRGANGVLASLWRVEDESTALLMQQLYRLLSGDGRLSKAEALRQAQIKLLRGEIRSNKNGEKFSHPYFWAPFVMMGNWL